MYFSSSWGNSGVSYTRQGRVQVTRRTLNSSGYLVILWMGLKRNELMESSLLPPSSIAAYRKNPHLDQLESAENMLKCKTYAFIN